MRALSLACLAASLIAFSPLLPRDAAAQTEPPRISGPIVHENLAVYFIHGPSAPGPVPLTLQEAMDKGTVQVIETGSVNQIKIENTGSEEVFIQSGDIVKGGQQDRVIQVSFVLPAKSGQVPIASFCVESGRWRQRGAEARDKFSGSKNALPSREAKLALKAPKAQPAPETQASAIPTKDGGRRDDTSSRQQEVWKEVAKTQQKLSGSVKAPVAAAELASSLQLSLENDKLKEAREGYLNALRGKGEAGDDITGYAFAINGQINSADIYPSNGLFRKMWGKLLEASVTEAIGGKADGAAAEAPPVTAVAEFLADAEKGKAQQEDAGVSQQDVRDADKAVYIESKGKDGKSLHRNYLKK